MTAAVAVDPRRPRSEAWRHDLIKRCNGRCHYCNREGSFECGPGGRPWHVDHMTPLALGGTDDDDNLTLSCKRCNLAKGAKPYAAFKALARAAYWQPTEGGPSEFELDELMETWTLAQRKSNGEAPWRMSDEGTSVVAGEASGIVDVLQPAHESDLSACYLAIESYAMVPRLVAEVRLLRGLLAAEQSAADVA